MMLGVGWVGLGLGLGQDMQCWHVWKFGNIVWDSGTSLGFRKRQHGNMATCNV